MHIFLQYIDIEPYCLWHWTSKLEPFLTEADQFDIIKVTTDYVLPLPALSPNTRKKDITVVS